MKKYHQQSIEDIALSFNSSLSEGVQQENIEKYHQENIWNELPVQKKSSLLQKIIKQLNDTLVLILIVAAVISFALGDFKDGIVITIIIVANAFLGILQENKAENAIAALQKLSQSNSTVLRNGKIVNIPSREVIVGDVLIVEAGDKIAADGRVAESVYLKTAEAALTGESQDVEKRSDVINKENVPIGDRVNMVYKDTVVTHGRGKIIVTAVGVDTEIGRISQLLQKEKKGMTPLEKELHSVGKILTIIALVSAGVIFIALFFLGSSSLKDVFFTGMSIAIAVVPEGIPTVVTTVLAIAVTKLAKKQAIVRKMSSVETLGSTNYILTDKTGTLTKNEMTVVEAVTEDGAFQYSNTNWTVNSEKEQEKIDTLLKYSVICNDTKMTAEKKLIGDPTETAFVQAALDMNMNIASLHETYTRIDEIPFSSTTKRMIVVVQDTQKRVFAIAKGAVEVICEMSSNNVATFHTAGNELAQNGIRALGVSYVELPDDWKKENAEEREKVLTSGHTMLGVIGLQDPVRDEVQGAVAQAAQAGISTVMITGDHKMIAYSIGKKIGIVTDESEVLDGTELGDAPIEKIQEILKKVRIFSRVSPEQKLRIVQACQKNGNIVAVTGDGVNDAPAIKTADIGVAMGISGTDVTKEVADIVLRDDNYSTIVNAIHQGRIIFANFIKFLRYQISCNISGVFIIFIPIMSGFATPLLPIHILLLNLVSETGPSIALGLEKGEKDIMSKKPRSKKNGLLTKKRWIEILFEALLLTIAGLAAYFVTMQYAPHLAITMTLTTAFLSRLWHAFNSRSETHSIFSKKVQRNSILLWVVLATLLFFMILVYTSFGNTYFSTTALPIEWLLAALLFSLFPVVIIEIYKKIKK